ncbi:MAG: WD40 repeat domain-containing serine/threonine protein kinase [Myxococcota bacterium]
MSQIGDTTAVIGESDFDLYCPVCTCCLEERHEDCPECHSPRPPNGWEPLSASPHTYLGKTVDGRYLVDRFLGSGTTGSVYRGVGTRIRRPFALKIVNTQKYGKKSLEEEMLRRFEFEVEALSRLRNPHVVGVYESMQLAKTVFVLVMDYVEGVTLQERLDNTGRMEISLALSIVRQVANGLHEAHSEGIIHRDLKPENIMIEQMPASGVFARILDFGIAYMVDTVRQTAGFRGTPLYAAPEQCQSDADITERTDIYALGCVLFHALTGRPPFEGKRALAVMESHVSSPVPSISDVVEEADFPPLLDTLVTRMLAKEPAARPQDLGEVIRELDRVKRLDHDGQSREIEEPPPVPVLPETHSSSWSDSDLAGAVSSSVGDESTEAKSPESPQQRVVRLLESIDLPEDVELGAVTAASLSHGGEFAAIADKDGRLYVLGLKSDIGFRTLKGVFTMITSVAIDTRQGRVYAASIDGQLHSWSLNVATAKPERVAATGERIFSLDIDSSGNRLVFGTDRGEIRELDIRTRSIKTIASMGSPIGALGYLPTEKQLMATTWEGHCCLVSRTAGDTVTLSSIPETPRGVCLHSGADVGAVLTEDGQLWLMSLSKDGGAFEIESTFAQLKSVAFGLRGELSGVSVQEGQVRLWLIRAGRVLEHLGLEEGV